MSDSCNPMDCNPPGSSVQGIFQARSLEWVAISFSKESSEPRDWTRVYSELPLITCPNMNVLEKFCPVPKQSQERRLWQWCRYLYHSTCHLLTVGMRWRHLLVPRALFNFFFDGGMKLFYWGALGEGQRANRTMRSVFLLPSFTLVLWKAIALVEGYFLSR